MTDRPDLVDWVRRHSVTVSGDQLGEMQDWCSKNVGEDRGAHPIWEAHEGWIDYMEGDWALDGDSFWFHRKTDMMKFMLTFS